MSIWDNNAFDSGTNSFVTFDSPGDGVEGTVLSLGTHTWPAADDRPERVVPKLVINTADGEKTLTAGQVQLIAKLKEARPEVGDNISIQHTRVEKRGTRSLKHFDVNVTKASADAPF